MIIIIRDVIKNIANTSHPSTTDTSIITTTSILTSTIIITTTIITINTTIINNRTTIAVVVKTLRILPKNLEKGLDKLEIRGRIETIQTIEFQKSTSILREVLETRCHSDSDSSEKQSV